ncbi:hypothetical protein SGPA1_50441 [Streptomyces misionensis JCM 4497]
MGRRPCRAHPGAVRGRSAQQEDRAAAALHAGRGRRAERVRHGAAGGRAGRGARPYRPLDRRPGALAGGPGRGDSGRVGRAAVPAGHLRVLRSRSRACSGPLLA